MADELRIHVRTVDFHLGNLRRKVKAQSLVALALVCVEFKRLLKPI